MITFSNSAQIKYNLKKIDIFSFTRIFFCTDFANFKLNIYKAPANSGPVRPKQCLNVLSLYEFSCHTL